MPDAIIWDGLFDNWTSYGVISNNLVRELQRLGVTVYVQPWKESTWIDPLIKQLYNPPAGTRILRLSGSDSSGHAYYNMLTDTPPCKESIARLRSAPYVLVSAQGTKDFLINRLGFGDNVRVVHRGASFPHFERISDGNYIFLYAGYFHFAKGVDLICKAFEQAFLKERDVRLILKGNDAQHAGMITLPAEQKELLAPILQDDRVDIIRDNWPHEDMEGLYHMVNAFVYPFRVLGFSGGKCALEARKSGCVTIMPAIGDVKLWGTQKYLFNYCEVQGEIPYQGFDWGLEWSLQYDVEAIAAKMREAYEDRAHGDKLEGWTWKDAAKELIEVLNED